MTVCFDPSEDGGLVFLTLCVTKAIATMSSVQFLRKGGSRVEKHRSAVGRQFGVGPVALNSISWSS